MGNVVIKAEDIGKLYKLGEIGTGTISHDLNRWWAKVRGKEDPFAKIGETNDRTAKGNSDWVWALKDINFEVKQGEVLGIIGRNGAGKSTLLKILSKVTAPTTGRINIKGRIASLLEVGTGFHPELTGRENIFLNGAILGMTKAEIRSKFDEIVDFSGVERYIDTPVKRYSSGMYVRLAFAVAAFLEPEILIVDEVLAVGDAEFQKKCLGRMKDVSENDGRTVLFVSHNMGAISSLCSNAILLNRGIIEGHDKTGKIIAQYFSNTSSNGYSFDLSNQKAKFGDEIAELVGGSAKDEKDEINGRFFIDNELKICMKYKIKKNIDAKIVPNFHFYNGQGDCIFVCNALDVKPMEEGYYEAVCIIPSNFLNDGIYFVMLVLTTYFATSYEVNFVYKDALSFEIVDKLHGNPLRYNYAGPIPGFIRPRLEFNIYKK